MFKRVFVLFLLVCFAVNANANRPTVKTDTLFNILKLNDQKLKEKKLIRFINSFFEYQPLNVIDTSRAAFNQVLVQYNVDDRLAYQYFVESIYQERLLRPAQAISALRKAIDLTGLSSNHYLLYSFFSHLAFFQTSQGSTIDAVSSFRAAKKEATIMNDYYSQVIVSINISDIYYKNNFYTQSLIYLNQALDIFVRHHITEPRIVNLIYYNKAENFFRIGNMDSLKSYNQLLNDPKRLPYKIYFFRNRTAYFISLLKHDYHGAINQINSLRTDKQYKFDDTDEQNLADAYFNAGMPDSAKNIIIALMTRQSQTNHPETKYHLYELLGQIAELEHNDKQAAANYKMALQQSKDHINRLNQVGTISTQMNADELQNSYIQREDTYRRERLLLIFVVIVAALTIIIGAMFYRNAKQKRYYEKLLFESKKAELAFINSHEVRRHLSNILGIVQLIKHSDKKFEDYLESEKHLLNSAESLDEAIRNISEKLDD